MKLVNITPITGVIIVGYSVVFFVDIKNYSYDGFSKPRYSWDHRTVCGNPNS